MLRLRDGIVELYKKVATSIPPDVEEAMKNAHAREENDRAREALAKTLDSIRSVRQASRPVCLDIGIPTFRIKIPRGLSQAEIRTTIREATVIATQKIPLSQNAVDVLTGTNSGDNTGIGFPIIYIEETPDDTLTIDLMLNGGDSEKYGQTYRLPVESLNAGMDMEGVRLCVLDSVRKAQGRGCPPYTVAVGIGGSVDQASRTTKQQLFRRLSDSSEHPAVAELEKRLFEDINQLGIGPLGLGGKATALGVKIGINHRHTESFIVDVALCCWANRRGRLIW